MKGLQRELGFTPKLIMLDLDGTLVDSAADIALCLNQALADLAYHNVSEQQVREWVGRGAPRLIELALQHVSPNYQTDAHRNEAQTALLNQFMQRYQVSVCQVSTVYPGVFEFIDAAEAAGIHLACVTNKPYAPARALLDELGLLPRMHLLIGGDTLAHRKPHPEQLLHCLRHFDVAAADALMVGDSYNDIEAARACGVRSLAVPYGYNHGQDIRQSQPDMLVNLLSEVLS